MQGVLRWLVWFLRIVVFAVLFGLALKNSGTMELHFFFDRSWQAPVSVVILLSFASGVTVGLLALAGRRIQRKSS